MDQLGQKFKIDFLLFPKWIFFQLYFGAKKKYSDQLTEWNWCLSCDDLKGLGAQSLHVYGIYLN